VKETLNILAVDVGTTAMKMGVLRDAQNELKLVQGFSKSYAINNYNNGLFSDIEPEKWQKAFIDGCRTLSAHTGQIDVIALSGTTPGMTAIATNGEALYPAILMFDQRSRKQAQMIIDTIGLDNLLSQTSNMPVAGGCSLASILWLKDNEPEVYRKTAIFGHSNTFIGRWLTGESAIDPSSASLTALYNTVKNDLTWNKEIAEAFGLTEARLPKLIFSHDCPGRFQGKLAKDLGFCKEPPVVIGGNDAVLAAYSVGIVNPGEVINVNGTCEVTLVCLPKCFPSCDYNIRAHVIPNRWMTLHVMNAGGTALEWFHDLYCREMSEQEFFKTYLDRTVDKWQHKESAVRYVPFLMGSRYSQDALKAALTGLTRETSREEILNAMVRGLCEYQRGHLKDIALEVPLDKLIHVTGGAATPAIVRAKKKWMRNCSYAHVEQSSMRGAALLGVKQMRGSNL
jgi:sugar (pentulose or hexulose) kinase